MSFLGLSLLQWTALAAIAGFVLAAAAIVTVRLARADRQRDDTRRKEDRQWDSDPRQDDREHDAELRREDREREDQRLRDEQCQREDDDAQQQVVIDFLPGGPLSQAQQAVTTGGGITHRIIVTTPAAYPVKQIDGQGSARPADLRAPHHRERPSTLHMLSARPAAGHQRRAHRPVHRP